MPLIRTISGLRATLGDSLSPMMIVNHVAAFDKILQKGKIIVGRDGRPSGEWMEQLISGTLSSCGRDVELIGIVPSPTVQLAVEHSDAAGGISITASHNPEEWNGMKFINGEGVFLDLKENTKLWNAEKYGVFSFLKNQIGGEIIYIDNAINKHISSIMKLPLFTKDILNLIKKNKFRVVVDAVNAGGSKAIPEILRNFGCEVIELHCKGNGIFPHTPEPISINLLELATVVKEKKADLGVAVDPDADRLVLIDETGTAIGEERTIALAVEAVLSNLKLFHKAKEQPVVVVNQSTTQAVNDICTKYDVKLERSSVGEINVVKAMKKYRAVIGGEGSGGVILPACHYGRDSLVGTALILYLLSKYNKTLSELVFDLPQYKMVKNKCYFKGDMNNLYSSVIDLFPNGKAQKGDGIKVLFPRSWVQVRASNTEPIVRIIAEDPEMKEAKRLMQTVMSLCDKFR